MSVLSGSFTLGDGSEDSLREEEEVFCESRCGSWQSVRSSPFAESRIERFGVFDLFGELVDEESTIAGFACRRCRCADRLVENVGDTTERLFNLSGRGFSDALGVRR